MEPAIPEKAMYPSTPMILDPTRSHPSLDHERGAAAVELALILPVLLLLVFGIVAFGEFYSRYQVFQGAVREGARAAAARETPDQVRTRVDSAADPYAVSQTPSVAVASGGSQCTTTTVGETVTVQWMQTFDIALPFVPPIDTNIRIRGVFRCE